MSSYLFMVLANAAAEKDAEYNEWYDNVHLPDVLGVPGFVAAQRFRLADMEVPQVSEHRYLTVYEIESDNLEETKRALSEKSRSGQMVLSTAMVPGTSARYFEAIGPRATNHS